MRSSREGKKSRHYYWFAYLLGCNNCSSNVVFPVTKPLYCLPERKSVVSVSKLWWRLGLLTILLMLYESACQAWTNISGPQTPVLSLPPCYQTFYQILHQISGWPSQILIHQIILHWSTLVGLHEIYKKWRHFWRNKTDLLRIIIRQVTWEEFYQFDHVLFLIVSIVTSLFSLHNPL